MKQARALTGLVATGAVVVAGFVGPGPAMANDGAAAPAAVADCAATLPLTTPCKAAVANVGNNYTVTLPGVGTLTFSLDAANNVVNPVATADPGFTASTPAVDHDGAAATFVNATTGEKYKVDADVRPAATPAAAPTVDATVKSREHCDHDHDGDKGARAARFHRGDRGGHRRGDHDSRGDDH